MSDPKFAPTGKMCAFCQSTATMTSAPLLAPGVTGESVHVCEDHFTKALPALPPLPGLAAAKHAHSLLTSRPCGEKLTEEGAYKWIASHLNIEYADAWLAHLNEGTITY